MSENRIIAIRIRGGIGVKGTIKSAMDMLNLRNQHNCVILTDNPSTRGMLQKVQGYITFGIGDAETIALLEAKLEEGKKQIRLAPPRKGFERKGIKVPFVSGGALGDRKEKINELVKRMI